MLYENLTRNSQINELIKFLEKGLLRFLINLLRNEESYDLISTGLDCFRNIFDAENYNQNINFLQIHKKLFINKFLDDEGDKLLEKFQECKNENIYQKTTSLIDDFFETS